MSEKKIRMKMESLYDTVDKNFFEQFQFRMRDTNLRKISFYMYTLKDASSLAVARILFGIAMLFDIPNERGGANITERWGNPSTCHFPLLHFIQGVRMPYMALVYAGLWIGALGITLGYKFRLNTIMFTVCYWYLLLIEKSYWNNHSYLFGLVGFLFSFTQANCCWSIDAYLNPSLSSQTVPYWNYFILKYQFFILYFMAGLKKGTAEWLTGYSVQNLSEHWVFNPFKLFLSVPQTDYLVVHWFVFAFDLTVAVWMMWSRTRHLAMFFCALFHLMNSRLFRIGMFPWVCLATMPLFYPFYWPKLMFYHLKEVYLRTRTRIRVRSYLYKYLKVELSKNNDTTYINDDKNKEAIEDDNNEPCEENTPEDLTNTSNVMRNDETEDVHAQINDNLDIIKPNNDNFIDEEEVDERKRMLTCILVGLYVFIQLFLPFSHFITKGYNNWTNGLYGYSWDMMVHSWDVHSVVVKVVDNERNNEFYVDPYHFTPNDRWTRHGDMVHQYARCLRENMAKESKKRKSWDDPKKYLSENISIYLDVWSSLNGRFTQRMFDPKVDLLKVSWSPFSPISYLMPLLDEGLDWREHLLRLRESVYSWNNYTDVIFIADFPGYDYEKYIPIELTNVTLNILDGLVAYEPQPSQNRIEKSYQLQTGNRMNLPSGMFHKVVNLANKPAFYMYTFYNSSSVNHRDRSPEPNLPIIMELLKSFNNMVHFATTLIKSFFHLFINVSKCQ